MNDKCKECGHSIIKQEAQLYSLNEFKQLAEKILDINDRKCSDFRKAQLQKIQNLIEKNVSKEEYEKAMNEWDEEYKALVKNNTERFNKFIEKWNNAINKLKNSEDRHKIKKLDLSNIAQYLDGDLNLLNEYDKKIDYVNSVKTNWNKEKSSANIHGGCNL
jgi:hypothetical protein